MIQKADGLLHLRPEQRTQVFVCIDATGGGEERIDWLLDHGYRVHIKMFSWRRAANLAQSVAVWRSSPGHPQWQVGLVGQPYRFVQPTIQVAVRSAKATGSWSYNVAISSLTPEQVIALSGRPPEAAWDAEAIIQVYADVYNDRSGPMEHSFSEDHQGLPLCRRHRRGFVVHEMMLVLLSLAHNTVVWAREWLAEGYPQVRNLGILHMVRDVFQVSGLVTFNDAGHVVEIAFNIRDPWAIQSMRAWQPMLAPLDIAVTLAELQFVSESTVKAH